MLEACTTLALTVAKPTAGSSPAFMSTSMTVTDDPVTTRL
jgi:hypothetical protein